MAAELRAQSPVMVWWLAARPRTLVAAVVPVLVGTALAFTEGRENLWAALAALMGAFFIQIGTNLVNDVVDFKKGADTAERLGPMRVTQAGLLSPGKVAAGAVVAFGLAVACGLYLTSLVGWPLLLVGVVSILCGIAYTAGPYPLAYRGLGDLFVFVFFGVVATLGTYWVETLALAWTPVAASVPVGLLAMGLLVVNNLRDIEGDARVNKRTLAVRLGRRGTIAQYRALLAIAYLSLPVLWGAFGLSPFVLLPLVSLVLAVPLWRDIGVLSGAELNGVLARTARLQLVFGALLALGVVL